MAQETITAQDILQRSLERNRYFYGKLMTVRDFTQEQLYFNAKRWLLNRLLFGSGVICGLKVNTGSDPTTIVIGKGLALDPVGREVTVIDDNPVDLTKLIELSDNAFTGNKTGFLCLAERDCPRDPVPALASSPCDETCESNRWQESFDVSWDEEVASPPHPTACQNWLNRATVAVEDNTAHLRIERTTPLWVRAGETFEAVVRVTALADVNGIRISEDAGTATLLEPTPQLNSSGQFPTPPVNLKAGEFFVYVYQVKAPNTPEFQITQSGAKPPTSTIKVLSEDDARTNEAQLELQNDCGDPKSMCVRIAKLDVHFNNGKPDSFTILDFAPARFRYSLERVTQLLDCVRASLHAEAGSARPGHAFITFNDLETTDLKPIANTASHGTAFSVTRGDHVHALLRAADSGLEFIGPDVNQLRINGTVGGEAIRFLNIVKGQGPVDADDLVTKDYVDAHIAGLDWQESVIDKDLTEPPKAPNDGDRYLLFNDPTAAWPSAKGTKVKKNDIVTFDRKLWVITTPDEGTATFVEDENVSYLFMDGTWTPFLAAPTVAAGDGLIAKGAIFSVGKGAGIVVNPDDVGVAFENNRPNPVGPVASPGKADTSARGDHVHDLPLAKEGGLVFDKELVIDGPVGGKKIVFLSPVAGQTPTGDEHLATKKYVDDQTEKIEAGDGLIRKADTIFVGQGAGIQVNPDDVAVAFDPNLPQAIAAVGSQGKANTVTRGDHAHALTLADQSGLAFDAKGLRVDGTVGGAQIRFVNRVSGQDPQVNEDLATKRYVDAKVVPAQPVVAGGGLIASDHTISVGPGDGLLIGEDSVAVKFSTATLPDSDKGDPGAEAAASRGDHRHPLPKITPATASGIVIFQ